MSRMEPNNKETSVLSILKQADGVDVWLMFFGFIGSVGDGLAMPVLTLLTAKFMNSIGSVSSSTTDAFTDNIQKNAVVMCWVALGLWVACSLEGYCWMRTSERQASRLRARYLKAVLRQDVSFFDLNVNSTAEVITTVSSDIFIIQDVLAEKFPVFLMNISTLVGGYLVGFLLLWRLAITAFPFLLLLVLPGLLYGRVLMGLSRRIKEEYIEADKIAEQAISHVRTVYSCVGEKKATTKYSMALERTTKLGIKQGLAKGLAIGSNGLTFSIWAFVYYYGSRMVMYHGARGGTVFAVGAAMAMGGLSLGTALSSLKSFSEASAAIERISEMMKRIPEIDSEDIRGEIPIKICGEIELKNVIFSYPSRPGTPIFKNLNLKVQAGRTVALVGESGSGKSTVISLIQRFYDPLDGQILLDGVSINEFQIKWLRSQMGLVSQEPALFGMTIKENILFGKEDADMEQVVAAAKISNAHDFISQLPQQYDTQVGERGVQVSGGQKQRIAIARAIIKEPRIILLDEATSALDSKSEQIVQQALDRVAIGRTTIIIAHRLSTIRHADVIAVFQNGHVVETGSHDELLRHDNGLYSSLVHLRQTQKGEAKFDPSFKTDVKEELESTSYQTPEPATTSFVVQNESIRVPTQEASSKSPLFRRLLKLNSPEWKQATLGCIGAVLFGAVQPVFSFLAGAMISVYFSPNHDRIKEKTKIYACVFVGFSVFSFTVNVIQHYNFGYMGEMLTKRVRERMLSKMLTFEVGWFDKDDNSSGALCSRLAKDANILRSLVGDRMALLLQATSAVAIAFTMGLIISWRLSIVIISVQPLTILCFYFKRVVLKNMSNKIIKSQNDTCKLAAEAVTNFRTVTSFSSQARILKLLEEAQQSPRRESIRQSWFAGLVLGTSQCLMGLSWALDFWYGGKLIAHGYVGPKAFFEAFLILINTGRIIGDAGTMTSDIAKGSDAVSSVFELFDRCTEIDPMDESGYVVENLVGNIEIRDVEFAYPARPNITIFVNFSIKIEAGKSTALVGSSGSGKSTVISLIERFYDPSKGVVEIDGRDLKSYNLRSLRKHIALVSQEPTLFSGTILENIIYGVLGEISELEVIKAAKDANAHEFISCLKDGYGTVCGEEGLQLSGGQKQRIAIARALLKNPVILLLDEATSALDSQSEKVVQEAIERVMVQRTSVIVAHRLSTIQNCETIAFLERGRVVESGTHSSLLAKMGSYYSLVNLQRTSTKLT